MKQQTMSPSQFQTTTNNSNPSSTTTYQTLKTHLLTLPHTFTSPPTSPSRLHIPQTNSHPNFAPIATLRLHPTLESTLHLLNNDLNSAHFLVRHAESSPAHESMYLHGILHRIEMDVDNARAWYADVRASEVLRNVWGDDHEKCEGFLGRVERWRDRGRARKVKENGEGAVVVDWAEEEAELSRISLWELTKVLEFCERKFGTGCVEDATSEYTLTGDKGEIASKMIIGGEGWREF